MKHKLFSIIGSLALLVGLGCVPVRLGYVDMDNQSNLKQYKTFRVVEIKIENETALEPQKANLERLVKAIHTEMGKKGFNKSKDSDLLINIGITMKEQVTTRETDIRDAPVYMGQRNYHWESEEVVVGRYDEGSAILHMVDTEANKLIWEGAAIGTLSKSEEKMEKRINLAMEKLFKKFPFSAM